MKLKTIIQQYKPKLIKKHGHGLACNQKQAIHAIERCRTKASGEAFIQCTQCEQSHWTPLSCGHRHCPTCQNHEVTQWLERQKKKLLPIEYFMVTFTLPSQLRKLTWRNQKSLYSMTWV